MPEIVRPPCAEVLKVAEVIDQMIARYRVALRSAAIGQWEALVVIDRPAGPGGHSRHANAGHLPATAAERQARTDMNHGQHKDGTPITDTDIEAMADEAERGYDVDTVLRRRRGGRPPLGSAAASVESVRLDPELKRALLLRATREHVSVSEVIRRAIGEYLQAS